MRKHWLLPLTLVLLLSVFWAVSVSGQGSCTGIVVTDADATWCNSVGGSSTLEKLLNMVADRIFHQYADANKETELVSSSDLETQLALVVDRIYMQYADANSEKELTSSSTLEDLLDDVADRIYFQYADANREHLLSSNSTLNDLLAQVADRVYFQYADANLEKTLLRPCEILNDTTSPQLVGELTITQSAGNVTASWITNELGTSTIQYGTQSGSYPNTVTDSLLVTEHAATFSGVHGTTYYFRVVSDDGCGNTYRSPEQTITIFDVAIHKEPSLNPAFSGEDLTYTIVVTNTSDVQLSLAVVDTLPAEVTSNEPLSWMPVLAAGEIWQQELVVTIDDDYIGTLTNEVTVSEGNLSMMASNSIEVVDIVNVCGATGATIVSVSSGDWDNPATWNTNTVPGSDDVVVIRSNHTVSGADDATVQSICNLGRLQSQPNQDLRLVATNRISNTGQIVGLDGGLGSGNGCGERGGSLELRGAPIYNQGVIRAGKGGDGSTCGGNGGHTMIYGRDTTNHGTICAGAGGSLSGTAAGQAGHGGNAHIWGKAGGSGFLRNDGLACAGDGGNGNPAATEPQHGGCGGTLKLMASPVLLSNGRYYAGVHGRGTGGGNNGCRGRVIIDPELIDLSGSRTEIVGGDVIIFGGDDWVLDLSNMSGMAISATNSITLAVGSESMVDLRGNDSPILHAGEKVVVASDSIEMDGGMSIEELVDTPSVETMPSQILYDVSLTGPSQVTSESDETVAIPITVLNSGPMEDTYTLSLSDTAGWTITGLPESTTISGLEHQDLTLQVTPAKGENTIIITATSQADPSQIATLEIAVTTGSTDEENMLYLPTILR